VNEQRPLQGGTDQNPNAFGPVGIPDNAGERLVDFGVDRMRDHIKKAPPRSEPFDLNEAIDEVIEMVQSAITKNWLRSTSVSRQLAPASARS
jgi:hypothetical protein